MTRARESKSLHLPSHGHLDTRPSARARRVAMCHGSLPPAGMGTARSGGYPTDTCGWSWGARPRLRGPPIPRS